MHTYLFRHGGRPVWLSRFVAALAAVFATIVLASCASSQGNIGTTQVTQTAKGFAVEVILKDYEIVMPESVPAGEITFNITNAGQHPHNLEVDVAGTNRRLDNDLKPGETHALIVPLSAGTYDIECPVALHAPRGMRRKLTVTGATGR
jgi:uncharacterized cupredoxin-like copper-binding protein